MTGFQKWLPFYNMPKNKKQKAEWSADHIEWLKREWIQYGKDLSKRFVQVLILLPVNAEMFNLPLPDRVNEFYNIMTTAFRRLKITVIRSSG